MPDQALTGRGVVALDEEKSAPANLTTREGEHTYYADGTSVVMRWKGGEKRGVAAGVAAGSIHAWQVVVWSDGTRDNVAPHVLHRAASA